MKKLLFFKFVKEIILCKCLVFVMLCLTFFNIVLTIEVDVADEQKKCCVSKARSEERQILSNPEEQNSKHNLLISHKEKKSANKTKTECTQLHY